MTHAEKLRDPRWQRRRLEVMQNAGFACERCADATETLNVHHVTYRKGADPWDYEDDDLRCLCQTCHRSEHAAVDGFRQLGRYVDLERMLALVAGYLAEGGVISVDMAKELTGQELPHLLIGASAHYHADFANTTVGESCADFLAGDFAWESIR